MDKKITKPKQQPTPPKYSANHHHDRFAMGMIVGIAMGMLIIAIGFGLTFYFGYGPADNPAVVVKDNSANYNKSANGNANANGRTANANSYQETDSANENVTANIETGTVENDQAEMDETQKLTDGGAQAWRLDPLMVASAEGVNFGLSVEDEYRLIFKDYSGEYSGTGEAIVEVKHKDKTYLVNLYQPVTQGEKGIWAIGSIEEK